MILRLSSEEAGTLLLTFSNLEIVLETGVPSA